MLVFVSGGVRSGKSSFAEKYILNLSDDRMKHYIATSVITDQEMKERIERHKRERSESWITWEKPMDIGELNAHFNNEDVVLLDCLTILTANELFKDNNLVSPNIVFKKIVSEIDTIQQHVRLLLVVSNDIFSSGISTDTGTFTYMKLLGALHQELVNKSTSSYQVIHGLTKQMKG